MHKFGVITLKIHGVVKFYTMSGVGTIPAKRRAGNMEKDHGQEDETNKPNNFVCKQGNTMLISTPCKEKHEN